MPKPVLSVLDQSPSHMLHRALQLALDIYTEETGAGAVTQRQFAVLAAAATGDGLTQSSLVKMTGIDRSTLADMVSRMTEKSLLSRQRSATDARANTVALTAEGRAVLETVRPKVMAADLRILDKISPAKRDGFLKLLHALVEPSAASDTPSPTGTKAKPKKLKAAKPAKEKGEKKKKKKLKKALVGAAN
jgi:DNA-binding MarR family transcriptional regulator